MENYELLKTKEVQFNKISIEQKLRIQDLEEKLSTRVQMLLYYKKRKIFKRDYFNLIFLKPNRISSLNNDIENKDLEVNSLKKKYQNSENEKNNLVTKNEKLK